MKNVFYIALIALVSAGPLRAQLSTNTNAVDEILALVTTNAPAPKPQPPRAPTHIESDRVDFDLTEHEATYRGHVYVDDPEMKLHCEWLVADLPQTGHISHIVAETNVVIDATDDKGRKIQATGDKAVYTYNVLNGVTNEIITLTGNAKVENAQGWLTGEPITLDCVTKLVHADNAKMVYWQNLHSAMAATNSLTTQTNAPLVETNLPPAATNPPATDTHLPPEKPDPIHQSTPPPKNF